MGLIDDKKNVFTTIGAYTSLIQNQNKTNTTNLFPSINNKKEIVPYLLDTLKVVVGSSALKDLTGKLFTEFIDDVEPKLKESLKKQFINSNSGNALPSNTSVSAPVKKIDLFGKFKSNPNSKGGSLLWDKSTPSFDNLAYQAIVNDGTDTDYNNLTIRYNSNSDNYTFKPKSSSGTIGQWISDYIDNTTIINKKEFMTNVMDSVYGSVASTQGKTLEELIEELKIKKTLEQLIDDNDSFEISQNDLDALLQQAQALLNGVVYYDMGCGTIGASLSIDDMTNLISKISGSTDSFAVGNAVEATVDQSTNGDTIATENKQTVKDGFFQRIIKVITLAITQAMTTSPQIRMLLIMMNFFQSGDPQVDNNSNNDLKNFKVFLKCIISEAMKMINEFIFNLVVSFLIAMLVPIIKKIIKEKVNQYIGIIKSLIL